MAKTNSYSSRFFHLVIELEDILNHKEISELELNDYLRNEMKIEFYAFILHDSDKDSEGREEHKHYHIVISCNTSYAKSTIINGFANGLECNVSIISCRKIKSFVKAIQYLIHWNDKDKFQYDFIDIWTNDINELSECIYSNVSSYDVDIEMLIELCKKCDSLADVYLQLGLEKSKKYRSLIVDVYREEHLEKFL